MEQGNTELNKKEAALRELAKKQAEAYLTDKPELYYVSKDDRYWKFNEDSGEWVPNTAGALKQSDNRLRSKYVMEELHTTLGKMGHLKDTKTYSFKETAPSVLNMLRPANWLQPEPGSADKFFSYLLTAISGGKAENALHIKQLVGWKYLHPDTWQLPALAWYGRGGAGKNLFVEKVLGQIFTPTSVAKRGFKHVEKFTESIAGRTIVFFDERPSREDESLLKFLVGQPTLSIEPKGLAVYDCENTAWYIIATNGDMGPVHIENNGTERRWSLIKTRETLVEIVAQEENVDQDLAQQMIKAADTEVFSNPREVAKFLNECVEEAKKLDVFPHALHGEDYEELVETQRDIADDIFLDVFVTDKDFSEISLDTLHKLYMTHMEQSNPGATPMSSKTLNGRVMSFIVNNGLDKKIKRTPRINVKQGTLWLNKSYIFYNALKMEEPRSHVDNSSHYLKGEHLQDTPQAALLARVSNSLIDV